MFYAVLQLLYWILFCFDELHVHVLVLFLHVLNFFILSGLFSKEQVYYLILNKWKTNKEYQI